MGLLTVQQRRGLHAGLRNNKQSAHELWLIHFLYCSPCLQRDGAEAFILDLRNNPGGMVSSAMEIAGLWIDGPAPVFNVEVRQGAWAAMSGAAALETNIRLERRMHRLRPCLCIHRRRSSCSGWALCAFPALLLSTGPRRHRHPDGGPAGAHSGGHTHVRAGLGEAVAGLHLLGTAWHCRHVGPRLAVLW